MEPQRNQWSMQYSKHMRAPSYSPFHSSCHFSSVSWPWEVPGLRENNYQKGHWKMPSEMMQQQAGVIGPSYFVLYSGVGMGGWHSLISKSHKLQNSYVVTGFGTLGAEQFFSSLKQTRVWR